MIRENETGWLFESKNIEHLAEILAMVGGMADATLQQLGHEAREWVAQEYSPARYYNRVVELYGKHGVASKRV